MIQDIFCFQGEAQRMKPLARYASLEI
jgi:hypothetical protein